jgi:ABC-type molybdate transport system substrate-binding protein
MTIDDPRRSALVGFGTLVVGAAAVAADPSRAATTDRIIPPGARELSLALPNPEFEGVARQIKVSLGKVGGEALTKAVYETKVADGAAMLTRLHHRQTPLFLMQDAVDAGVTWQSEAIFQEQIGNPISYVVIPHAQNTTAIYAGAEVTGAPHRQAPRVWLDFIRSPQALEIFERYGFRRYVAGEQKAD